MNKLLLTILLSPMSVLAQDYPYVNAYAGVLHMSKYDSYAQNDTIKLGIGTLPSGDFKFISKSLADIPLGKNNAGKMVQVRSVIQQGSAKKGRIYKLILAGEGVSGYEIDIKNALASGEVVSKDPSLKIETPKSEKSLLIADELVKLKKLMDEGVLTKEEFDARKKLLLEQK